MKDFEDGWRILKFCFDNTIGKTNLQNTLTCSIRAELRFVTRMIQCAKKFEEESKEKFFNL